MVNTAKSASSTPMAQQDVVLRIGFEQHLGCGELANLSLI
jgi:hypothetical protein